MIGEIHVLVLSYHVYIHVTLLSFFPPLISTIALLHPHRQQPLHSTEERMAEYSDARH